MSQDALQASPRPVPPIGPTLEEWSVMSAEAREAFLVRVLDALSDPRDAMSEGRPHKKAKTRALDLLGLHFRAKEKVVYLAEEMAVVYPGEPSFSPDVLAVLGVEEPEDDPRLAWVVLDEGRGLDFVLEVLHHGDRKKDLVDNVERYARLAIPEYFVFDKSRDEIIGYRLSGEETRRYARIVPQRGRHTSLVLGVDLAVEDGKLRFFDGMAELFGTSDLLERLTGMMTNLEQKAEEQRIRAESALAGIRDALVALLEARGITATDTLRTRLSACDDVATLQRWVAKAITARDVDDVLDG